MYLHGIFRYFYELKFIDKFGFYEYYYFSSKEPIRSIKMETQPSYKLSYIKMLINDKECSMQELKPLPILKYIWYKHFKKTFHHGNKVVWENEIL